MSSGETETECQDFGAKILVSKSPKSRQPAADSNGAQMTMRSWPLQKPGDGHQKLIDLYSLYSHSLEVFVVVLPVPLFKHPYESCARFLKILKVFLRS